MLYIFKMSSVRRIRVCILDVTTFLSNRLTCVEELLFKSEMLKYISLYFKNESLNYHILKLHIWSLFELCWKSHELLSCLLCSQNVCSNRNLSLCGTSDTFPKLQVRLGRIQFSIQITTDFGEFSKTFTILGAYGGLFGKKTWVTVTFQ